MTMERLTYATAAVLQALNAGHRYGFDIADATGVRRGTIYPILRRLEEAGAVRSVWEDPRLGREQGRPSRKYYELTTAASDLLDRASQRYPLTVPAADPVSA